jgi:hypothetical protein
MSTVKEQYDSMLDELDEESKVALINHVPFAKILEEVDPIAYRCGMNDYQPTCERTAAPEKLSRLTRSMMLWRKLRNGRPAEATQSG